MLSKKLMFGFCASLIAMTAAHASTSSATNEIGSCHQADANPFGIAPVMPSNPDNAYNLELTREGNTMRVSLSRGGHEVVLTSNPPRRQIVGAIPVWNKDFTFQNGRFVSEDGTELNVGAPRSSSPGIDPGIVMPSFEDEDFRAYSASLGGVGSPSSLSFDCNLSRRQLARVKPDERLPVNYGFHIDDSANPKTDPLQPQSRPSANAPSPDSMGMKQLF